jgi:hypothetical protein
MRCSVLRSSLLAVLCLQRSTDAANTAGCLGCGVILLVPVAILILNILLIVWVYKDAKARGMDTPVVWMLLVFFFSLIGLLIYILARTPGSLSPCPYCGQKRLMNGTPCPHCKRM